jgi:hypothetical protein
MAKTVEETDNILRALHTFEEFVLNSSSGKINLPEFEIWLHTNLPIFNLFNSLVFLFVTIAAWILLFIILHYLVVLPIMSASIIRKTFPSV